MSSAYRSQHSRRGAARGRDGAPRSLAPRLARGARCERGFLYFVGRAERLRASAPRACKPHSCPPAAKIQALV
jgi:hypothetical protein